MKWDQTYRKGVTFEPFKKVTLCYATSMMFELPFKHYFLSINDGEYFIEFGGDYPNAFVRKRFEKYLSAVVVETIEDKTTLERIQQRAEEMMGFCNNSLVLRNSEHVANYIFKAIWYSPQVEEKKAKNPFNYFASKLTVPRRLNTTPTNPKSPIKPPVTITRPTTGFSFTHEKTDSTGEEITQDTHVVLFLGPTGAGKSRMINVLFDKYIADSKREVKSITYDVTFYYGSYHDGSGKKQKICFVDTIGVSDTRISHDDLMSILKGKLHRNVDHFNKVVSVFPSKLLTDQLGHVSSLLESIGAQKNPAVHLVLTGMELQPFEIRQKAVIDAKSPTDKFLDSEDVVLDGKTYPRCICTGFADLKALYQCKEWVDQFSVDKATLTNVIMYPQKNQYPKAEWKLCNIL